MTTTIPQRFIRHKRLSISLGVIAILIILLAALSYFWLPGYAKSQLEIRLSELLQRPVTVALIEIKPHKLELIVHGFQVGVKADTGEPNESLLSFDRFYIDLSIESLKQRAPVITAIALTNPKFRLIRETKDQLNISDLLEKFSQPSDKEEEEDRATKFSISNITIQGGHFEFLDRHMQTDHQITEINLGIPIIANFESAITHWVEPHFSAKINGSPFSLEGKLRPFAVPQEATLALKFNKIDLSEFDRYAPLPQGIKLLSGYFDSDLLVTFTQQPDQAPAITLTGNTTLRQLAIKDSTVAAPYRTDVKKLDIALTQVDLMREQPSQIKLKMDQVELMREGESEPALSLAQLAIDRILINIKSRRITLDEIVLDRLNTTLRRESDGEIDLTRMFEPTDEQVQTQTQTQTPVQKTEIKAQKNIPIPGRKPAYPDSDGIKVAESKATPSDSVAPPTSARKEASTSNNETQWTTQVKRIKLNEAALRYEDLTLEKLTPMVVESLNLTVDNVDLSGATPSNLALEAKVNQRGKIKVDGSLGWAPLAADLTMNLDDVDLVSLQGWGGDKLTALLTSGDISFNGTIKAQGNPLKIQLGGHGNLANFNVFDPKTTRDLLRWKKLDINDLNFVNEPLRVDVKAIKLSDFYARVTIRSDGSLNLKHIVRQDIPLDSAVAAADASPADTQPSESPQPAAVRIDNISLQQGSVHFNDRFIKPNYSAKLSALSGQIGPLQTGKTGKIDIRGMVGKTSPLKISGSIDPFGTELQMDIMAQVKDIDLPPFSPYSGKFIGYAIEKGKLSADVNYQVENGALSADNKIFLDQFTLGEKIDREDAVSLPLDLAITLLKNRRGEIDIHLPLQGSINDPEFNLGDIIFQAFVNLITKAITSPFTLLASAFEGGEELSEITFTPGFSTIEDESLQRLQTLSEVLNDRPSLELEISGHVDPIADHEGLKLAMLQNKVKAQKLAEDVKKGVTSSTLVDVTLAPEEYSEYLEMAYKKETFEKPTNLIGLTKSIPDAEMEQLMLEHTVIHDNDLEVLAENRANAARNWLIENGEVASDRIFVVSHEAEVDDQKAGSRVEFSLK
ncbi:MAG: DUF748 domain-containing protein [Nitrosomonas sp.]|uniref:DUF748 domain-containing protein n=1 Tax=Nitrosomonas sp. TaxID=42353 RepID=UPI0025D8541F|nr:DUF748 domain-containing protein [Nitrosomonas sp.]MBY0474328.1 DUF748 domain-containing protein [Nitrosomonas sp.]